MIGEYIGHHYAIVALSAALLTATVQSGGGE